jgi:MFS family permease
MNAAVNAARPMGAREVLRVRDFRTLWLAQLISDIGDGLTATALLLLVNHLTGSTAAIAAMAIALAVPPLTVGLVAGAYADRWDRRRIMLASDLSRAVVVLGFVIVGTAGQLPILYGLAFLQASVGTFFNPAKGALLPHAVPAEGLMAANSVSQATRVIAGVAGTSIAGVMIGVAGVYWPAFVLDAASFIASFLLVSRLPAALGAIPTGKHAAAATGVRESLAIGLRAVAHSRILWVTILCLSLAMLGLGAINVLFVPLLINVLQASAAWFGPLEAAQTASMVLAAGVVGLIAARISASRIVVVASIGVGAIIVAMGQVSAVWQLLILMFFVGWFITPFQAAVVTILQLRSEDSARGRVMSVLNASMSGTSVISIAAAGLVADRLGVPTAFVIGGSVCIVAGLVGLALYPRDEANVLSPVAAAAHAEVAGQSS